MSTVSQISGFTAEKIRPSTAIQIVHYEYRRRELAGLELPMGVFDENFTLDSFLEESVHLGDQFAFGSAEVVVTQPRLPCYKLGLRFESDDMVKRFFASGRTGFYLAVNREGEVVAGIFY